MRGRLRVVFLMPVSLGPNQVKSRASLGSYDGGT